MLLAARLLAAPLVHLPPPGALSFSDEISLSNDTYPSGTSSPSSVNTKHISSTKGSPWMNSSADILARLIANVPNPSISPGKALVALVSMISKPAGRTSPFLTTLIYMYTKDTISRGG